MNYGNIKQRNATIYEDLEAEMRETPHMCRTHVINAWKTHLYLLSLNIMAIYINIPTSTAMIFLTRDGKK